MDENIITLLVICDISKPYNSCVHEREREREREVFFSLEFIKSYRKEEEQVIEFTL